MYRALNCVAVELQRRISLLIRTVGHPCCITINCSSVLLTSVHARALTSTQQENPRIVCTAHNNFIPIFAVFPRVRYFHLFAPFFPFNLLLCGREVIWLPFEKRTKERPQQWCGECVHIVCRCDMICIVSLNRRDFSSINQIIRKRQWARASADNYMSDAE